MSFIEAILFGAIEGLTEFLPISSTGHLILLSHWIGIEQTAGHKSFEIIIQLGAILAVIISFFNTLFNLNTIIKLTIAFIPTGIAGFILYDYIKLLFHSQIVAYMLIIGGIIFILTDFLIHSPKQQQDKSTIIQNNSLSHISYRQAFIIGCFQIMAMIPGTSRSGATIIGGLLVGLNKIHATTFSFLLAVPTMIIASSYELYKNYQHFSIDSGLSYLITGFFVSFIIAMIAIRFFLTIVKRFGFTFFGIYRILLGVVFLLVA